LYNTKKIARLILNCDGISVSVVKVVDFKQLAPQRCGFESHLDIWILACEEAIQVAYGPSVVLLGCPFVPEIFHGGALGVFLHQSSGKVAT
jgi:hypothetical protein